MSRTQLALVITALACLPIPAGCQASKPAATPRAYLKIEGPSGDFKGEATRVAGPDYIAVLGFDYAVTSPRDQATGQPSGKVQHQPVTITKAMDSASPQIYDAAINNVVLKKVTIEFITTSLDGKELPYFTIMLTNATVMQVHEHLDQGGAAAAGGSAVPAEPLEDVSFDFAQIGITSNVSQISATGLKGEVKAAQPMPVSVPAVPPPKP